MEIVNESGFAVFGDFYPHPTAVIVAAEIGEMTIRKILKFKRHLS